MRKYPITSGFVLLIVLLHFAVGCSKPSPPTTAPSSDKAITFFVLKAADNSTVLSKDITGTIASDTITLVIPKGTVLTKIVPTITFSGKSLSPTSNTTQDFSSGKAYIVTAEDNSVKTYFVTPKFQDTAKAIVSFVFKATDNPGVLSVDANATIGLDTILVTLPTGVKTNKLIPLITTTGASIAPASRMAEDFTKPVLYTVTATDGTTKNYFVVVTAPSFPAISGTVYVGNNLANLFALDAATGTLKWKYNAGSNGSSFFASPTVHGSVVYDVTTSGAVFALDTGTGKPLWSITLPDNGVSANSSTPTFSNGFLYLGSYNKKIYCLNASSGQIVWTYKTDSAIHAGVTVVDGVVYAGCRDTYLYALNATTGALIWKYTAGIAGGGDGFDTNPLVVNGTVYIGSNDGNCSAIDAATGLLKWTRAVSGSPVYASPTMANGIVYFSSGDGTLYALDPATGNKTWNYYLTYSSRSGPCVDNGIIYVGSIGEHLSAVDASTGVQKWVSTLALSASNLESYDPVVFGGVVYVTCDDGSVYAMDALTGTQIWKYTTGVQDEGDWGFLSSPCVVDGQGNVYHPANSGEQQ